MINFKSNLSEKEKKHITSLLSELTDEYGDFYITKNNLRLFIRENPNVLFESLKRGDKIAFNDHGMAVICGFSDKADRKYVKILTKNLADIGNLVKVICWNVTCDLFVKVKQNSPQRNYLQKNYFRFVGGRGREVLLVRKGNKYASGNSNKNQSSGIRSN